MERWRKIVGDYGYWYSVSDQGRVRRDVTASGTKPGTILKPSWNPGGYSVVRLSGNNTQHTSTVHKLVAVAFIPNPKNKPQVNHINFVRTDNRADNLEWATPQEDAHHKVVNGRVPSGENHYRAKLTCKQISEIRKNHDGGRTYTELAVDFNVNRGTIHDVVNNKTWKR